MSGNNKAQSPSAVADAALLNETQAAQLLGITIRALQGWRLRGDGPLYVKLGRLVRYRRSEIERWLDAHSRRHTSQISAED